MVSPCSRHEDSASVTGSGRWLSSGLAAPPPPRARLFGGSGDGPDRRRLAYVHPRKDDQPPNRVACRCGGPGSQVGPWLNEWLASELAEDDVDGTRSGNRWGLIRSACGLRSKSSSASNVVRIAVERGMRSQNASSERSWRFITSTTGAWIGRCSKTSNSWAVTATTSAPAMACRSTLAISAGRYRGACPDGCQGG
jgi:hypothetical protein